MAYIPSKDADLINWGSNYSNLLTASPTTYGVSAGEALLIQNDFDDFAAAYTLAIDPSTRTPQAVAHKDGVKHLFIADSRALATVIRANKGVADQDKVALGLNIPDPTPTSVPQPTTTADLTVLASTPNQHGMKYHDSAAGQSKAKPKGVIGAILFRHVGVAPVTNIDAQAVDFVGLFTKSPFLADVPSGNGGKYATYWTRWITRGAKNSGGQGQVGPVSTPVSAVCASFNPLGLLVLAAVGLWYAMGWVVGAIGLRKTNTHRRNRRTADASNRPVGSLAQAVVVDFVTPNITITWNQPVILRGIPQFMTDTSKLPTSASQTDDTHTVLVYPSPGSVTKLTIPQNDPGIHTRTGGAAAPGTFPAV